jgi:hypothetical protein
LMSDNSNSGLPKLLRIMIASTSSRPRIYILPHPVTLQSSE